MNQENDDEFAPFILNLYVLGALPKNMAREVDEKIQRCPATRKKVEEYRQALEQPILEHGVKPPDRVKQNLLHIWDEMAALEKSKAELPPPLPLHAQSQVSEYQIYLDHPAFQQPEKLGNFATKTIYRSDDYFFTICWLREGLPPEVHPGWVERFLIVEGTCTVQIGEEQVEMGPNKTRFIEMPVDKMHSVDVTSHTPCVFLMERFAA